MAKASRRYTADQAGLARALTGPQGEVVQFAARAARQTANRAKMLAPVDKGVLRNSIAADPMPKVTGMKVTTGVTASANYAAAVHDGNRGGTVIRPVNAKALRFVIGGRFVFAKSVTMSARPARPFLKNAADEVGARLGFTTSRVP